MKLYDYFRSTASYRVRIALHHKGLSFEQHAIHLLQDGGIQHQEPYKSMNPQSLVPSLELDDGNILTQSLAIIEYLDEMHPEPALLPKSAEDRAFVRSLALMIAADMHPLNNLRVLNNLKAEFQADEEAVSKWYHHWLKLGFDALEARLAQSNGNHCFGDSITLADVCLVPQVYNAKRFKFSLAPYPTIESINTHCTTLDVFQRACPEVQPDAPAS